MKNFKPFVGAIALLFLMLLFSSVYEVREGQQALLLRLGKIVTNRSGEPLVIGPGLHSKWPLITKASIFDTRLQTLTNQTSRIVTREKKDVLVDYYAKWRITNLKRYYTRTGGDLTVAEGLLEPIVNTALRAEFGKRDISEVVSGERSDVMALLRDQTNIKAQQELGVDIIDVRIKRIDLPVEVSKSVYNRMRAEREQIANEHRSKGKAIAEQIRAEADAKVTIIIATARGNAMRIRGEGDSLSTKIHGDAYEKDPTFYAFSRSLDAYRETFNSQRDIVVLRPDNQFFKYFNNSGGATPNLKNSKNSEE